LIGQHALHIPEAHGKLEIPAHSPKDHLRRKLATLERIHTLGHRSASEAQILPHQCSQAKLATELLRLFLLPPYLPDRNHDELVWKHLKADIVGRMTATGKEDFSQKVRRSMRELQNDTRKIISFFQKPSLKYAT
jgi:transposase